MNLYNELSDTELTGLLKSGDHVAFTEIYNRFSGLLYLHAYNKLRTREEAKDIIQELFTTIWNSRERIHFKTTLSGYLYAAVSNRIFKALAHKKVEASYISSLEKSIAGQNNITDHLVREHQLRALIEREIDALPDKMKEIFLLSRKAHLSHKEIAERLGIAEPTVKKQVNNALKILRAKLGLFAYLVFLIRF